MSSFALSGLFGIGVKLMRHMRIPSKMVLMGALLLVPMSILVATTYRQGKSDYESTMAELHGARVVGSLSELAGKIQDHRGLTNRALSGDEAAKGALVEAREGFRKAIEKVDQDVASSGLKAAEQEWAALRQEVKLLADGQHSTQRAEAFSQHSKAVARSKSVVVDVAEQSGLLLDPAAATYFMMDIAVLSSAFQSNYMWAFVAIPKHIQQMPTFGGECSSQQPVVLGFHRFCVPFRKPKWISIASSDPFGGDLWGYPGRALEVGSWNKR